MIQRGLQPPAKVVNDVAAAADTKEK